MCVCVFFGGGGGGGGGPGRPKSVKILSVLWGKAFGAHFDFRLLWGFRHQMLASHIGGVEVFWRVVRGQGGEEIFLRLHEDLRSS